MTADDSRKRVAVLYEDGVPTEIHYFRLPTVTERRFYASVSSYNGFRTREADRFHRWSMRRNGVKAPKPLKLRVSMGDLPGRKYVLEELDKEQPDLPRILHAGIFEFYEHVGFDYKRNSWKPRKLRTQNATEDQ